MNQSRTRSVIPWIGVAVAWLAAQGLSLFYPLSLFWDDWRLYDTNSLDLNEGGQFQRNLWPRQEIESALLSIHPGSFRVLTFLMFPLIAFITWRIAGLFTEYWLSRHEQNLIGLLVLFLPMNSARITNITFSYSLSLLAFMIGAWLWLRYRNILGYLATALLFLFSFRTSSLLAFTLVPALLGLSLDYRANRRILVSSLSKAAAPIVLAGIYRLFISDNGVAPGYNEFQIGGLARSGLMLTFFCGVMAVFWNVRRKLSLSTRALAQLGAGLFVLWLGAMPYMAVGHLSSVRDWSVYFLPGEGDWHSRHQLLLPFGVALILVGFFNILEGKAMRLLMPLVIAVSFAFTFLYSVEYLVDARKQDALILALRNQPELRNTKVVFLADDASVRKLNARARSYREYETDGILRRALGDDAPIFFDESQLASETCDNPAVVPVYRAFAPTMTFTKFQIVLGRSIPITFEKSSVLACLKPEFRS